MCKLLKAIDYVHSFSQHRSISEKKKQTWLRFLKAANSILICIIQVIFRWEFWTYVIVVTIFELQYGECILMGTNKLSLVSGVLETAFCNL